MKPLNTSQLKLLADFFSNFAIVWYTSGLLTRGDILTILKGITNDTFCLLVAFYLNKEVKNNGY